MAIPPVSALPLPVRAAGFIPAYVPPAALSPATTFSRIVDSAVSAGAPLPAQGLGQAIPRPDAVSLLQQSFFRDLVANVSASNSGLGAVALTPSFTQALGIEGLLGRASLPAALENLAPSEALQVFSAALSLFESIQALGGEDEAESPALGSLLDVTT